MPDHVTLSPETSYFTRDNIVMQATPAAIAVAEAKATAEIASEIAARGLTATGITGKIRRTA